MYNRNCFAFRTDGRVAHCDALTDIRCDGCPFFKPADELEYYETIDRGQVRCGYINKRAVELARLVKAREEINRQIAALTI